MDKRSHHVHETVDEWAGEWLTTRPGEHCLIRVGAKETKGEFSVVEIVSDPGDGTNVHIHDNEDEHVVVVEGIARIAYGDRTFDVPAGTSATLTRGIPHAWANISSERLRMVIICTPGGVEELLQIISKGGDIDFPSLAARFGTRSIGPSLTV